MLRQELPPIHVAEPVFDGREAEYVSECLASTRLSMGKWVARLEQAFVQATSACFAMACSNGTAALHLAVMALGAGPGDEVIVPSLTFVATANAVTYTGATPVFVDVDPHTWTIDPAQVERAITPRTRGMIAVHLYGQPADMDTLGWIARKHKLWLIEDAAEALGAEIRGQRVGSFGDAATFSLYGNKLVTCGEGGVVTTNRSDVRYRVEHLRGQGMDPARRYWHTEVGYNYRLTDLQAAVAVAQLENLNNHIERRRQVAAWYDKHLEGIGVQRQGTRTGYTSSRWMVTVLLAPGGFDLEMVAAEMADKGIETRPVFVPMHRLPIYFPAPYSGHWYAENPAFCENSDRIHRLGLTLPTHGALTETDVERVCQTLKEALVGEAVTA